MHVLSTPPAFILSQDQTLMFNLPAQSKRLAYPYFYLVKGFVRCIDLSMPLKIQMFDEFSGLHYCLFVKVLCRPDEIGRLSNITNLQFSCQQILLGIFLIFFFFKISQEIPRYPTDPFQ